MTSVEKQFRSNSSDETEHIGETIGTALRGGEIIELISDLGGGKTTLTRGIARGIGSLDQVASPTFTVNKTYYGENSVLQHFDFYRLQDPGIILHEISEVMDDDSSIAVIEWGAMIADILPEARLRIVINNDGDESRIFVVSAPEAQAYVLDALGNI